jgi:acyl-CoA synthetase (NDP forming)
MSLDRVLNAESVAIVGASKNVTKRGFQAIRILLEEKFSGKIYPVNPKEKNVLGLRCYPQVSDIEDPVDLVLITTPAKTIPAILDDCGRKGVHGAVIIAGGFGEVGPEGRKLEETMVEAARNNNIRLIGPNTSGMMNIKERLNLVGLRDAPGRRHCPTFPKRQHGPDLDHRGQIEKPQGVFLLRRRRKRGRHQIS